MTTRLSLTAALLAATALTSPTWAQEVTDSAAAAFIADGEYKTNWGLEAVKASAANTAGWTGQGVTVAVFDSGIRYLNPEMTGQVVTGYNAITKTSDGGKPTDEFGHGTGVASIIAGANDGKGVQGIAYDAKVMSVKIIGSNGAMSLNDLALSNAINQAYGKAQIYNNSWNSTLTLNQLRASVLKALTVRSAAAWQKAVDNGAIVVFAAGNTGAAQPGFWAALPQAYTGLQKSWLVAVATDQTGAIAKYSSRCGSTASFCMAAPGSNIVMASNSLLNTYTSASGTSFAAPILSGAAADLKQMWPQLKGDQIVSIMKTTANKSGIYANQTIYGQGMLDMQKAVQPVGTLAVATGTTTTTKTSTTSTVAVTSGAFGGSLTASKVQAVVLDEFDRDYKVDVSAFVQPEAKPYDLQKGLAGLGAGLQTIYQDKSMSFALVGEGENAQFDGKGAVPKFVMSMTTDGEQTTVAHGVGVTQLFAGSAAIASSSGTMAKNEALGSAYLGMVGQDAWGASWSASLIGGAKLTVAGVYGNVADKPAEWSLEATDPTRKGSEAMVAGITTRVSKDVSIATLGVGAGQVHEANSVLGSVSQGAVSLGSGATTQFAGVYADANLSGTWAAFGSFELGRTSVRGAEDSIVTGINGVTSNAWSLGVTGSNVLTDNDRFVAAISQPMRVNGGSASISSVSAVGEDGSLSYSSQNVGLAAGGREIDYQVGYHFDLNEGETVTTAAMLRVQPDNLSSAKNEAVGMVRYQVKF